METYLGKYENLQLIFWFYKIHFLLKYFIQNFMIYFMWVSLSRWLWSFILKEFIYLKIFIFRSNEIEYYEFTNAALY